MTGFWSLAGEWQSQAHILAVEQMNASGEFPFRVEVIIGDHKGDDPTAAMNSARKLISIDKVPWINSSFNITTRMIHSLTYPNNVVVVNAVGNDVDLIGLPWLHNLTLQVNQSAPYVATWAMDEYQPERIAQVWQNFSGPIGMSQFTQMVADSKGVEVVLAEGYEYGTTDFRSLLAKIQAANPDMIFNWAYSYDVGHFARQAREMGIDLPIVTILPELDSYEVSEGAIEGEIFGYAQWWHGLDNELNRQFIESYTARWDVPPEEVAEVSADEYEAAMGVMRTVLHYVIDNGGDPFDGAQLEAAIKEIKVFPSVYGSGQMTLNIDGSVSKTLHILRAGAQYGEDTVLDVIESPLPWYLP